MNDCEQPNAESHRVRFSLRAHLCSRSRETSDSVTAAPKSDDFGYGRFRSHRFKARAVRTLTPRTSRVGLSNRVSLRLIGIALLVIVSFNTAPAFAQKPKLDLDDLKSDILDDLNKGDAKSDLEGLKASHLSLIGVWDGVEPLDVRQKAAGVSYAWKSVRGPANANYVSPLNAQPIGTVISVPKTGEYRVYLREWLGERQAAPVSLKLEPLAKNATPTATHVFGKMRLPANTLGKEIEAKLPVRFESQVQLNTPPDAAMWVWEYADLKLSSGDYRVTLQSDAKDARVHALFLTQSKSFRPSFSEVRQDNTFEGIYLRYRILDGATAPQFTASLGVTYHWRGRIAPGSTEPLWYDTIGQLKNVAVKEWSPFIDVREQIIPGGGPWSTARTSFSGMKQGRVEVQFAWHPHDAAVTRTFETAVSEGSAMFRIPHGRFTFDRPRAESAAPRWGVWDLDTVAGVMPEEAIVEKYFVWADDAAKKLGVQPNHPKPKHLHVLSSCRTAPVHRTRAAEMLAKLGVNWIPDAPPSVSEKFGLYSDADRKKIKLGDEISTYTAAAAINSDAALTAKFHSYLNEQAALVGSNVKSFFGVDDVRHLECLDKLPSNAGRFERRLFYCSQRFCHVATVGTYARLLRDVEKKHPNAIVYNNYSPHPVFLTGRDMNGADWFLLPRAGAQTLGWAEDWATGGSWGLGTPMTECTTFYAALVECSVRKHGYPSGFYVGSNCGYTAQKMFSCVSQGISILHLYDWGPIDAWAEGSNAWSEMESQYLSVMQGTHALGPVDEIVAKGQREARKVGLLYNRSHEILSGDRVWLNRDWMWTFLGLRNSQIPVDIVIEEDLTADGLAPYEVLYVGGLNLERRHLQALREWVERGGVLIGSAGFAQRDVYGDRMPETVSLFGAEQRLADASQPSARTHVKFAAADFPAIDLPVTTAGQQCYVLNPTSARPIATYDNGDVAAVSQSLGKGRTILLGVTTGEMYRGAGGAKSTAREWLVTPAVKKLNGSTTQFDCPESEVTRFDHEQGIAVLIAIYSSKPDELSKSPGKLSVRTDRNVREVLSGLRGPLKWQRVGDRIEIETPAPAEIAVDSVLLR